LSFFHNNTIKVATMRRFVGTTEKCKVCNKTAYEMESFLYDKVTYHITCFRCLNCKKRMEIRDATTYFGALYCKPCFNNLLKTKGKYDEVFKSEKGLPKAGRTSVANAAEAAAGGAAPDAQQAGAAAAVTETQVVVDASVGVTATTETVAVTETVTETVTATATAADGGAAAQVTETVAVTEQVAADGGAAQVAATETVAATEQVAAEAQPAAEEPAANP